MQTSDLTEQYLNKLYDDLQKEQMKILADIKSGGNEWAKEKDNQKQFTLLNTLMMGTLRLRNLRKQIEQKVNL
ncbi:MAG: hypothetical protein EB127_02270 [Alphaproteobacteria bacterium]|nr:hypothetical protein [Alphaproteobacteria bacterium]